MSKAEKDTQEAKQESNKEKVLKALQALCEKYEYGFTFNIISKWVESQHKIKEHRARIEQAERSIKDIEAQI